MKNLSTVFRFEFLEMAKKRSTIISTLVITMILVAMTFVPSLFLNKGSSDNTSTTTEPETYETLGVVVDDTSIHAPVFKALPGIHVYSSETALKEAVEDETVTDGIIIKSDTSYSMLTLKSSMFNQNQQIVEAIMTQNVIDTNLAQKGIDPNQVREASTVSLSNSVQILGKDASQSTFVAFGVLFVLYMLILLYGQSVATSVAREKDSRTMELLITSTKPKVLILGKVLAVGLIGILQVVVMILGLTLGYMINKGNYPEFITAMIQASITWDAALIYAIFSISGYFLYLFIFASLGSLVTKVEDVSSAVTPITFVFVIAYLLASFAMGMPDATVIKFASYIPFVSLFTTPIRYMMTTVPVYELVASLVLMIGVTVAIANLSIYIYRKGSLNYGNRMKFSDILKQRKFKD
ncbi:ABC transporter permease [Erysipelothrix aquatica]|uniref:ABC transporter permease n=1 Tax=Erysipelothrix aquatica TaxID=2683714 RepID=UPI0013597DF1|nr:ABC transporter permease [Erysipelothrix aquatica]